MPKNWCFWTVVLEKTLDIPLDSKEIQPVHPKGDQFWVFIGRTDAKAETRILWTPDGKNWFIWKDPDTGKGWRQEEKGTTEDEMVGWHHRLNGHEFEWTLGVGDGQGGLACCSPWGHKEWDTTEQLNWTEKNISIEVFKKQYIYFRKSKIINKVMKQVVMLYEPPHKTESQQQYRNLLLIETWIYYLQTSTNIHHWNNCKALPLNNSRQK